MIDTQGDVFAEPFVTQHTQTNGPFFAHSFVSVFSFVMER